MTKPESNLLYFVFALHSFSGKCEFEHERLPAKAPVADVVDGLLACVSVTCSSATFFGLELAGTIRRLVIGNSGIRMRVHWDIPPDILIWFLRF